MISFCGALISPRTLETRPDFGSYFGRNIVFATKLNPRDGDTLEDFMEKRLNFLVTVNLDRLYQGPCSIPKIIPMAILYWGNDRKLTMNGL